MTQNSHPTLYARQEAARDNPQPNRALPPVAPTPRSSFAAILSLLRFTRKP